MTCDMQNLDVMLKALKESNEMSNTETVMTVQEYMAKEEQKVVTFCGDCIFAQYAEQDFRPTQVGCSKGRLTKLEAEGGKLVRLGDTENERDYYVIENRICNMCRGPAWQREVLAKGLDVNETLAKEIKLKPTAIVYMAPKQTIAEAIQTMQDLDNQELKPTKIIVMNNAGIFPRQFLAEVPKSIRTPWTMEFVVEFQTVEVLDALGKNQDNTRLLEAMRFRCIDLAMQKVKSVYYSFFFAGSRVPSNYFSDIDRALNEDLIRLLALAPGADGNGLFMHRNLHMMVGGNFDGECLSKAMKEAEQQKCPALIRPITEVVKNYE